MENPAPSPESGALPATGRAALVFILITVLLDIMALGISIPVWPQLIEGFVGTAADAGLWVGISGAVWALMQFLCQPIVGALSDRVGRRPIILASNFGTGLDYIVMAAAPNIGWLLIGRVISGITASSIGTAFAYIADVTEPKKRAAAFGLIGATFGLGFILGPVIGGHLGDAQFSMHVGSLVIHGSPRLPFWLASGLSLINATYGLFVLPESLSLDRREPFRWSRANPVGSLNLLRSHPDLLPLAVVEFLAQFAHYVLQTVFVLYAGDRYHWGANTLGQVLACIGVCASIVQGGLTGVVVRWLGERKTIAVALVCGAIGFAIYGLAPNGTIFMIGVPVMSLWGMAGPSTQSLMSRRVSATEQGKLQGANMSIVSIAGIFGPMVYGGLYSLFNGRLAYLNQPGAPFYLASVLLMAAMVMTLRTAQAPVSEEPAGEAAMPMH